MRTVEFRWAVAAMLGVIVLGTLQGILAAVVLSMVSLLRQANDPAVHVLGRKPGTEVFPSADATSTRTTRSSRASWCCDPKAGSTSRTRSASWTRSWRTCSRPAPRVVVLDLSAVPDIEYTGLKSLTELEASLRSAGTMLKLAALNPAALAVIQRAPLGGILGEERLCSTLHKAVDASRSN